MVVRDRLCLNIWKRHSEYGKDLKESIWPKEGHKWMQNKGLQDQYGIADIVTAIKVG
jgi:hypothetical protein